MRNSHIYFKKKVKRTSLIHYQKGSGVVLQVPPNPYSHSPLCVCVCVHACMLCVRVCACAGGEGDVVLICEVWCVRNTILCSPLSVRYCTTEETTIIIIIIIKKQTLKKRVKQTSLYLHHW